MATLTVLRPCQGKFRGGFPKKCAKIPRNGS
nr:MAG TPA: hypothetical protein [Caudoviricetes sp.]DAJ84569.1 MAG TPA: hypothetical protein [Caudoviricetes sp.]